MSTFLPSVNRAELWRAMRGVCVCSVHNTREMGADLDVQDLVSLISPEQIWDMCLVAVAMFHTL